MRLLRYDEDPRHRLKVGEGFVHGGREFEVEDDDLADSLLANPRIPVTEIKPYTVEVEGATQEVENG